MIIIIGKKMYVANLGDSYDIGYTAGTPRYHPGFTLPLSRI
jgi:hypothetical protein